MCLSLPFWSEFGGLAARSNAASRTLNTTMSTSPPKREHSDDSNPPPGTYSSTPRRPIYQTETTGNYWVDVREAFKVRPILTPSHVAFLSVTFFS